jgi:histidine triad (HIT) family protein
VKKILYILGQSVLTKKKMVEKTLFQKIIDKEIPADILYEDDLSIVIRDINPQAPTHLLIIPKLVIDQVSNAKKEHKTLLGHLLLVAGDVSRQIGCHEAFRLVVNNGEKAQQTIFHLHIHLLAEREFSWPPG